MSTGIYLPPKGGHSRRGVLKKGLFGGLLLALGGGGALFARASKKEALPPEGLLVLGAREYAVIAAIARRVITPREGFPGHEEIRTAFNADRILAKTDLTAQEELLQLINLFENALPNFLFGGRVVPFTQQSDAEQDAVLAEWSRSKLTLRRTGFAALRGLVTAAYFVDPRSQRATGYPGPPEGFHQPDAPVWKGEGEREGNGVWVEP